MVLVVAFTLVLVVAFAVVLVVEALADVELKTALVVDAPVLPPAGGQIADPGEV